MQPKIKEMITGLCAVSSAKIDIYTNGLLIKPDFVRWLGGFSNKFSVLLSFHIFNYDGAENDYAAAEPTIFECIKVAPSNVTFILVSHKTSLMDAGRLERWRQIWAARRKELPRLDAVHANANINPWAGLISDPNCVSFKACPYGDGQHLFIGSTGNVLACCMDLEEENVFGNIMKHDFDEIMAKRKDFYRDMAEGKREFDLCKRCITG
jgi:radical SAM protein with 4Fe4S-binding SPASM domain